MDDEISQLKAEVERLKVELSRSTPKGSRWTWRRSVFLMVLLIVVLAAATVAYRSANIYLDYDRNTAMLYLGHENVGFVRFESVAEHADEDRLWVFTASRYSDPLNSWVYIWR